MRSRQRIANTARVQANRRRVQFLDSELRELATLKFNDEVVNDRTKNTASETVAHRPKSD